MSIIIDGITMENIIVDGLEMNEAYADGILVHQATTGPQIGWSDGLYVDMEMGTLRWGMEPIDPWTIVAYMQPPEAQYPCDIGQIYWDHDLQIFVPTVVAGHKYTMGEGSGAGMFTYASQWSLSANGLGLAWNWYSSFGEVANYCVLDGMVPSVIISYADYNPTTLRWSGTGHVQLDGEANSYVQTEDGAMRLAWELDGWWTYSDWVTFT